MLREQAGKRLGATDDGFAVARNDESDPRVRTGRRQSPSPSALISLASRSARKRMTSELSSVT
jgi:hypothetical protein